MLHIKVKATVVLQYTLTSQRVVHHAIASRTAVGLVTTAPWQPALLPIGLIMRDYKDLYLN